MENENILQDDITLNAIEEYTNSIAKNEIIYQNNFNITIDDIRKTVNNYIATTGHRPIVIIDYLQVLKPVDPKATDKQQVDYNVEQVKKISRDFEIPLICISSFNRQNYYTPVTFEAFKESGGIEYTADAVIGLQYKIIQDLADDGTVHKVTIIAKKVKEAKNKIPREIQLVCLKNRSGKSGFSVNFTYNQVFNHYKEANEQPSN